MHTKLTLFDSFGGHEEQWSCHDILILSAMPEGFGPSSQGGGGEEEAVHVPCSFSQPT